MMSQWSKTPIRRQRDNVTSAGRAFTDVFVVKQLDNSRRVKVLKSWYVTVEFTVKEKASEGEKRSDTTPDNEKSDVTPGNKKAAKNDALGTGDAVNVQLISLLWYYQCAISLHYAISVVNLMKRSVGDKYT